MIGSDNASRPGLLIAAHGEQTVAAGNEATFRIARSLSGQGVVSEVAVGFIRGEPTIKDALGALTAPRILVYPLFVSNGYFTRDRLVQLLDEANGERRKVEVMAPLGLDPGLPDLVLAFATRAAGERGLVPQACNVILLAHGSRKNSASRNSTEQMARALESYATFRSVHIALLEESPFLSAAAASIEGSVVVVGMFSGEGLHGAKDAPRLVADLNRKDVTFAGVIGSASGIEDLIAKSVQNALQTCSG